MFVPLQKKTMTNTNVYTVITGDFGETINATSTSIAAETGKADAAEDKEDFGDFDNGEKIGSFDDADATE